MFVANNRPSRTTTLNEILSAHIQFLTAGGRRTIELRRRIFMYDIVNSTTTRTKGWQTDCWNWAKANKPFELYGVQRRHFQFCESLSAACHCKFHARPFRDEIRRDVRAGRIQNQWDTVRVCIKSGTISTYGNPSARILTVESVLAFGKLPVKLPVTVTQSSRQLSLVCA